MEVVPERHPHVSWSLLDRGIGNATEGAISAQPPSQRVEKQNPRREEPFGMALDGDGGSHCSVGGEGVWEGWFGKPCHPPSHIDGIANVAGIATWRDPKSLG